MKKTLISIAATVACTAAFSGSYVLVIPIKNTSTIVPVEEIILELTNAPTYETIHGQPLTIDLQANTKLEINGILESKKVTYRLRGSIPEGFSLNGSIISGSADYTGDRTFTVDASYKDKVATKAYAIHSAASFNLANREFGPVYVGVPTTIDLTGMPSNTGEGFDKTKLKWEFVDQITPAGFSLDTDSGVLSGNPSIYDGMQTKTYHVRASAGTNTATGEFSVITAYPSISKENYTFPVGYVGENYEFDLSRNYSIEQYPAYDSKSLIYEAHTLPRGLSIDSNGRISGIPTDTNTSNIQYEIAVSFMNIARHVSNRSIFVYAKTKLKDGAYLWADDTYAQSCKDYLTPSNSAYIGSKVSGAYWIQPSGWSPTKVQCDMETSGGGWTLAAWSNSVPSSLSITNIMVADLNPSAISAPSNGTASSINPERLSKALSTKDVMLVAPAMSASPYIELNQGVWSYDTPDCSGLLGHTGRASGCPTATHGANDNWDSSDKYNIAVYAGPQSSGMYTNAVVPTYRPTGEYCYSGYGRCTFSFWLR